MSSAASHDRILFGLRLRTPRGEVPGQGALEALFAGLPDADGVARPELWVTLATVRDLASRAREGATRLFFLGPFQAFPDPEVEEAFLLEAPWAAVRVLPAAGRIDVTVAEGAPGALGRSLEQALLVATALALREHGFFHLHAGAARFDDGPSVLVLGASGAGKTTTTLALLEAGARALGDDALFVSAREGALRLVALPRPFNVGTRTRELFPALAAHVGEALEGVADKRTADAARAYPGRFVDAAPAPAYLLCPVVRAEEASRLEPISAMEVTAALLESSALVTVPGIAHGAEQLRLIEGLVAKARALRVVLGQGTVDLRALSAS